MAFFYRDGINLGPVIDVAELPLQNFMRNVENPHALYRLTNFGIMFSDFDCRQHAGYKEYGIYGFYKVEHNVTHELYYPFADDNGIQFAWDDTRSFISWDIVTKMFYETGEIPDYIGKEGTIGPHDEICQPGFGYFYDIITDTSHCMAGVYLEDIAHHLMRYNDYRGIYVYDRDRIQWGSGRWVRLDEPASLVVTDHITSDHEDVKKIIKLLSDGGTFNPPEDAPATAMPCGCYRLIPYTDDWGSYRQKVCDRFAICISDTGDVFADSFDTLANALQSYDCSFWAEKIEDDPDFTQNVIAYYYDTTTKTYRVEAPEDRSIESPRGIRDIITWDPINGNYVNMIPRPMRGSSAGIAGRAGIVPEPPAYADQRILSGNGRWVNPFLGSIDGDIDLNPMSVFGFRMRHVIEDFWDFLKDDRSDINLTKTYADNAYYNGHRGTVESTYHYNRTTKSIHIKQIFFYGDLDETTGTFNHKAIARFGALNDYLTNDPESFTSYTWSEWKPAFGIDHVHIAESEYKEKLEAGTLDLNTEYFVYDD